MSEIFARCASKVSTTYQSSSFILTGSTQSTNIAADLRIRSNTFFTGALVGSTSRTSKISRFVSVKLYDCADKRKGETVSFSVYKKFPDRRAGWGKIPFVFRIEFLIRTFF
ncbi:hypothetical protein CH370_05280 [Leptospira kmetyi]|uniref:hypothetical protein n=1 Tax=Leptospira kmetyi TaxID=408139 RepID=UPI000CAEAB13|nr:hypothetical protein [Leptospira kmetyi]PJZ42624.1 hypothetical protein CH370_05280 [Leptospira kmetyi]